MMFSSIKHSRKGFTLIELLVVIAIIGILSSVVLASLSTARQKSRDAKRISDVGQIQLALELLFDASQSYMVSASTTADLVTAKYLPSNPVPPAGSAATYAYKGVVAAGTVCATAPCVSYALGIDLERSDNTVLSADADQPTAATCIDDGANDFCGGNSLTCIAASYTAGADKCYDVKP
jgi:prepilin-type N-terminal cleavage/methylation domain-containing protein